MAANINCYARQLWIRAFFSPVILKKSDSQTCNKPRCDTYPSITEGSEANLQLKRLCPVPVPT